jgi:hypothetical protein
VPPTDAAAQLEAYELYVLGDEARTPPPPVPAHNPLPTNDSPFGVSLSGPFVLPPPPQPPAVYGAAGLPHDAASFGFGGGGAPGGWTAS